MWPHSFAMHAVMVVDLQVTIEGRFPPGARQIAFGIEMPIVQRLIRELVRKFTQPLAEFKCLARGQTDKDDACTFITGKLSEAHAGPIDITKGLLAIDSY